MEKQRIYAAIDLKSFYASVECVERGLDPLTTNLTVADESRTSKTICLAVSPALKAYGIPGRARLFEVISAVNAVNNVRRKQAPGGTLSGGSYSSVELAEHGGYAVEYIVAKPRMALYMEYSTRIFGIYSSFVSPDDIHVYSVDEVFIDLTDYLDTYGVTAEELTRRMIEKVLAETGITATAGIGTNLYLAKVAMDIMAKRIKADSKGVRIACLDEMAYRRELWGHKPITDFWRVGRGIAAKLAQNGMYTMGDVARCSHFNEDKLYRLFGINAELLIDHAWGVEACGMRDIKDYKPDVNSISIGQVLTEPYDFDDGRLIALEMAEAMALRLTEKKLLTDRIDLVVGYEHGTEDMSSGDEITKDRYGRAVLKSAHGFRELGEHTASLRAVSNAALEIYDLKVSRKVRVRRMFITACNVLPEETAASRPAQMDMFSDMIASCEPVGRPACEDDREKRRRSAVLDIKKKFGSNAILKGMDLQKKATARERNAQIGGHKA